MFKKIIKQSQSWECTTQKILKPFIILERNRLVIEFDKCSLIFKIFN